MLLKKQKEGQITIEYLLFFAFITMIFFISISSNSKIKKGFDDYMKSLPYFLNKEMTR